MSEAALVPSELSALAEVANREHLLCEQSYGSAVQHALAAGDALAQVKAQLAHGEWLPWLEENFGATERHARNYMRVAANRQRVSDLEEGSLRKALAAISEPHPDDDVSEPHPLDPAGPRALGQQSRLVVGAVEKAQRLTELAPHFDFDVIRQLPNEEKEQWKQQLSSARTALSRLINAL